MKTKHWLALVLCAALFALPAYAAARDQDAPRDAGPVLTAPPETTAPDVPMGYGKADLLAAVAQDAFDRDLIGYQYISCGELCDLGPELTGWARAANWLLGDINIATQKGEKIPLGYFLLFPDAEQEPFYQVVSEQIGTADRALLDAVYAH